MALTRRAAIVALVGVLAVFVVPLAGATVLIVEGLLVLGIVIDLSFAGSVRSLEVTRSGDTARRLDEVSEVAVVVVNRGGRRVRGVVRDAWPPSARATPPRRPLDIPAGERRRWVTTISPQRRTELHAGRITVRSVGPLGLAARQGNHDAPWSLRILPGFPSRRYLPEKLAKLRILDGRTAARVRGQGTEFDSLARLRRGRRRQVDRLARDRTAVSGRRPHVAARTRPAHRAGHRHRPDVGGARRFGPAP